MSSFVVARYNENIDWLKCFQEDTYKFYVYNKGCEIDKLDDNTVVERLPNIGREAHTYLYHIVQNYETIAQNPKHVTFFTQGCVVDHGFTYHFVLRLIEEARSFGFSESVARPHMINEIHRPYADFRILEYRGENLRPNKHNESYKQWFQRCIQRHFPCIDEFKWCLGAIFCVRNDMITSKGKEFYVNLLAEIQDANSLEVAHFFERSWYYVFVTQS